MEGFQPELLVILLYMSLIYEVITGLQKRASKIERMKKLSSPTASKRSRVDLNRNNSQNHDQNRHRTARHFVQMRIVGRD